MTESARIAALPRRTPTPLKTDLRLRPDAPLLRDAQLRALGALEEAVASGPGPWGPRGMAGLIGCGHGKTLIAQLAPVVSRCERPLLLLPARLSSQLDRDIADWSPFYPLANPCRLHYELLSQPSSVDRLERMRPDMLILDEAHKLANPKSARWRRVSRYLRKQPDTRVVIMSGTLSWKKLRQMRHLMLAALRDWCPLPATDHELEHWGALIDVGGEPSFDSWRVFEPVSRVFPSPEGVSGKAKARHTFRERLSTCPGVVLTAGVAADVSLRMRRWTPVQSMTSAHEAALLTLQELWQLPDGTELVEALDHHRHAQTLALGFYNRIVPGTLDPVWDARRKAWASVVRKAVEYGGWDSPALVERAVVQGRLGRREERVWCEWQEVADFDPPPTETVWVDRGYPLRVAQEFLAQGTGVIWVRSQALGHRLAEAGLAYHGQGSAAPTGGDAVVSIDVHATGWDGGQRVYDRQLVMEAPRSAATWEQMLARLHRPGATNDVSAWVLAPTMHQRVAIEVGLAGAHYVRGTQGAEQRLLLADWESV